MPAKQNKPLSKKEDIAQNPDNKIDQDFEGYPHGPAKDETIKPQTKEQEEMAGIDTKDGEKMNRRPEERESIDEQDSDGSANAFENK